MLTITDRFNSQTQEDAEHKVFGRGLGEHPCGVWEGARGAPLPCVGVPCPATLLVQLSSSQLEPCPVGSFCFSQSMTDYGTGHDN